MSRETRPLQFPNILLTGDDTRMQSVVHMYTVEVLADASARLCISRQARAHEPYLSDSIEFRTGLHFYNTG